MEYKISQEQLDNWQRQKWEKDNVLKIMKNNGFILKPDGRSGTIYFSDNGSLCEIYVEMSGVPEYDMLVFVDNLEWSLPEKKSLTNSEAIIIKEKLKKWLNEENIKSDI